MMKSNPKRDHDDEAALYKNRVIYSLPTHAGEWLNALATREQLEYLHADRKNHCGLIIQKTRKMFRHLLKPIVLNPTTAYVSHHKLYQIQAHGFHTVTACGGHQQHHPLVLAGLITDREIDTLQHFIHGCGVSASFEMEPVVRNSFEIISCEWPNKYGPVMYGDDCYIQIAESDGLPLYLQCENETMDTFGAHQSIRLSQSPDIYCRFRFLHWKPVLRDETAGTAVVFENYHIIQHTASGKNLAVEMNKRIPTFFGTECVVSCCTFRDSHKMETSENMWRIIGAKN